MRKVLKVLMILLILAIGLSGLAACNKKQTPVITAVELNEASFVTNYNVGDALDLSGATLSVRKSDDTVATVNVTESMVSGFSSDRKGNVTLKITYQGFVRNIVITVTERFDDMLNDTSLSFVTMDYSSSDDMATLVQDRPILKIVTKNGAKLGDHEISVINSAGVRYLDLSEASMLNNTLPEGAFSDNSSLIAIRLPANLRTISSRAFAGAVALRQLAIPASVSAIASDAFLGDGALEYIYVENDNTKYSSAGGVLYSAGERELLAYPRAKALGELTLQSNVNAIGQYAFYGNEKLTKLTLTGSTSIIGDHAFDGCVALQSVEMQRGLTELGSYAFSGCVALTSISLPVSLTEVSEHCFDGCTALSAVVLPERMATIDGYAFANCSALTKIDLGRMVTEIDVTAFHGCESLAAIHVDSANPTFAEMDGVLCDYAKQTLYCYPAGRTMESNGGIYELREGIKTIASGAFDGTKLTTIVLSQTIENVEDGAFVGNSLLTAFRAPSTNEYYSTSVNGIKEDGILYTKAIDRLVCYPQAKDDIVDYVLPDTIAEIADGAFDGVSALESLRIDCLCDTLTAYALKGIQGLIVLELGEAVKTIKSGALAGAAELEELRVSATAITIERNALGACSPALVYAGEDAESFYGWYSAESGGVCLLADRRDDEADNTLTAELNGETRTLYARFGNYVVAMEVLEKEGVSRNYYTLTTSNQYDNGRMTRTIAAAVEMKVTMLSGAQDILPVSAEMLVVPANYEQESDDLEIFVEYAGLTDSFSVRFKNRDTFKVTYLVNDSAGGSSAYYNRYAGTMTQINGSDVETTNNWVQLSEGYADQYATELRIRETTQYQFTDFIVTIGENRSEYFSDDDLSSTFVKTADGTIAITNLMCDLIITAYTNKLVEVGLKTVNVVAGYEHKGGTVTVGNSAAKEETIEYVMKGGSTQTIRFAAFTKYPALYGENPNGIYGFAIQGVHIRFADSSIEIYSEYNPAGSQVNSWSFFYDRTKVSDIVLQIDENQAPIANSYGLNLNIDNKINSVYVSMIPTIVNGMLDSVTFECDNVALACEIEVEYIPYFAMTYLAGEGGNVRYIAQQDSEEEQKTIVQYVLYGENSEDIIANADDCYNFLYWENGAGEQISLIATLNGRSNISASDTYTANFKSLIPTEYIYINTAEELENVSRNLYGNYVLQSDIDMTGRVWTPLGVDDEPFYGSFDGEGHTISNLTISGERQRSGFFGVLKGEVKNLNLEGVTLQTANQDAGSIAGYVNGGSISACSVKGLGLVVSASSTAFGGGIAGQLSEGVISNSYVFGYLMVSGGSSADSGASVGGLVGKTSNGYIFNSYTNTRVYAKGAKCYVGGLVGVLESSTMRECFYIYDSEDEIELPAELQNTRQYTVPSSAIAKKNGVNTDSGNVARLASQARSMTSFASWSAKLWQFEDGEYPALSAEVPEMEIYTAEDLKQIFSYPSGNYKLMRDIVLTEEWVPVPYFSGTLDGNRHTISNMEITSHTGNVGFISKMGSGAIVKNVAFYDVYIEIKGDSTAVGAIVGVQNGGIIFGASVSGAIVVSNTNSAVAGGIVGLIATGSAGAAISNSYSLMSITGSYGVTDYMGGAVGWIQENARDVNISFCFSASTVYTYKPTSSGASYLGALVGWCSEGSAVIENNFYIRDNLQAINAANYTVPNDIVGNLTQFQSDYNLRNNNEGYKYIEMPKTAFEGWNASIWKFVEYLIPHLYYETEYFMPDVDENGDLIGRGDENNPFQISTYQQLKGLKTFNLMHFKLGADIDCSGKEWESIMFRGGLDGNGHSILNLTFSKVKHGGAALFYNLNGALISNLNILNMKVDVTTDSEVYVAGIAMVLTGNSIVTNCAVSGQFNVKGGADIIAGGLVAEASNAAAMRYGFDVVGLQNSYAYVDMSLASADGYSAKGTVYAGGLVGRVIDAPVTYCYAGGTIEVRGRRAYAGGAIGSIYASANSNVNITRIDTDAEVYGYGLANSLMCLGGLVGMLPVSGTNAIVGISKCAVEGKVGALGHDVIDGEREVEYNFGGVVGRVENIKAKIADSYSIATISLDNADGLVWNNNMGGEGSRSYRGLLIGWSDNFDDDDLDNISGLALLRGTGVEVAVGTAYQNFADYVISDIAQLYPRLTADETEEIWIRNPNSSIPFRVHSLSAAKTYRTNVGEPLTFENPRYIFMTGEERNPDIKYDQSLAVDWETAGVYVVEFKITMRLENIGTYIWKSFVIVNE